MKKIIISVVIIIGLAVVLMPSMALAAISVTADDWTNTSWTGSRSSTINNTNMDEIITQGEDWIAQEFVISWNITKDDTGLYTYVYTIEEMDPGELSHWILEVTEDSKRSEFYELDPDVEGPKDYVADGSNPQMISGIYGIKFNTETTSYTTFSFKTSRDPVWGDFYAKDGNGGDLFNVAYNAKFGVPLNENTVNFSGWIARPNGGTPPTNEIPEPASMLLLGSGLLGLAGLKRKK